MTLLRLFTRTLSSLKKRRQTGSSSTSTLLVTGAQLLSVIYSPRWLTVFAFGALLTFSYLNLLTMHTKLWILGCVAVLTVIIPFFATSAYRSWRGWTHWQLSRRTRRFVPYLIHLVCYAYLLRLFRLAHLPGFATAVIIGALALQVVCAAVNNFLKISTHAAASAAVVGAIIAYAFIFAFDPTWWVCLTAILCGAVCSARLVLRQHTLGEIGWGAAVGFVCGFGVIFFF